MSISEFVVREQADLWQVWHDGRLVSDQPSQFEGLCIAERLAHAAAARGERARLFVGELDSHPIEFPAIEPRPQAAPEQGMEKAPPERGQVPFKATDAPAKVARPDALTPMSALRCKSNIVRFRTVAIDRRPHQRA